MVSLQVLTGLHTHKDSLNNKNPLTERGETIFCLLSSVVFFVVTVLVTDIDIADCNIDYPRQTLYDES